MNDYLIPAYNRLPIHLVKGQGVWLWDDKGNQYIDGLGGIAVCILGHAHEELAQVINQQAQTLWHVSNLFQSQLQQKLAGKLCQIANMEKAFFCNSGAEANECAIKIARAYGRSKGYSLPLIIVMEHAFHGRTMATLSATGNRSAHAGFEPLVSGFVRVPFNDLDAIKALINHATQQVVAVFMEPVQGEGGINIANQSAYLPELAEICRQQRWLLMFDEVQTGVGRSGKWYAHQHCPEVMPDVITTAKALGNGFPVGACLVANQASNVIQPGMHGTTYGGNPLAMAVSAKVLEIIERDHLLARATQLGQRIVNAICDQFSTHDEVIEVRHLGMLIGVELKNPCAEIVHIGIEKGLILNVTQGRVIRLAPPINLTDNEADQLIKRFSATLQQYLSKL